MEMTDLFDFSSDKDRKSSAPLAARMRPRNFSEFIGQEHIVGEGKLLRRAIEADRFFSSIILWGPPGTGKTTLAELIANQTHSKFEKLSAILAGKADLKLVIDRAINTFKYHRLKTVLFVDEIHRWNKAQQDALLPFVENGTITLIGATTENPFFEVNSALVSRSRIFQLRPLLQSEIYQLLISAISDTDRGYGEKSINISDEALRHLSKLSNGDARNALNALELAVESTPADIDHVIHIDLSVAEESIQQRAVLYDEDGDAHYDTISAFIKSVRGSDPDAALFWLAKMIKAGEDPKFILRRLVILAGEDIGMADPFGLVIANSAFQAFEQIGMPEGIYPLVEVTLYLATAPKSNSAKSYFSALQEIEKEGYGKVPKHLQDNNRDKITGHGEGYLYPHDFEGHFVSQSYLPKHISGHIFYEPGELGYEKQISERLKMFRKINLESLGLQELKVIELPEQSVIDRLLNRNHSEKP